MKTYLLYIILNLTSIQNPNNQHIKNPIPHPVSQRTTENSNHLNEANIYKELYENAKENNEKLLSTIYWTLGTSLTFLLAIFGGQIFFNWRVNKKEIDYINKDTEEKIGELKANILKELQETNKENQTLLNVNFEKIEKEIKERLDQQLEEKSKLFDIKEELNDLKINSLKGDFERDLKRLKIEIEKTQGDLWILKGVERNALSRYIDSAILNIEIGYNAKYILDDIIELLNKIDEIHTLDEEGLIKLSELLSEKYSSQKEKINELYINKPVYYFSTEKDFRGIHPKIYVKNFEKK